MPDRCVVPNCRTGYGKVPACVSVHKFPSDPLVKAEWVKRIGREYDWQPTHNSKVCSLHFVPGSFRSHSKDTNSARRNGQSLELVRGLLHDDAVPTIFPPPKTPAGKNTKSGLKCVHCANFEANTEVELKSHLSAIHLGYFPVGCGICLKKNKPCWLANDDNLRLHSILKHPGLEILPISNRDEEKEERLASLFSLCTERSQESTAEVNLQKEPSETTEIFEHDHVDQNEKLTADGASTSPQRHWTRSSARSSTGIDLLLNAANDEGPEENISVQTDDPNIEESNELEQSSDSGRDSPEIDVVNDCYAQMDEDALDLPQYFRWRQGPSCGKSNKPLSTIDEAVSRVKSLSRSKPPPFARWSLGYQRQAAQSETAQEQVTVVNVDEEDVDIDVEGDEQTDESLAIQNEPSGYSVVLARPQVLNLPCPRRRITQKRTFESFSAMEEEGIEPVEDIMMDGINPSRVATPLTGVTKVIKTLPKKCGVRTLIERSKARNTRITQRMLKELKAIKRQRLNTPKTELLFSCSKCNARTARTTDHVTSKHLSMPIYSCLYCQFWSGCKKIIKYHNQKFHPEMQNKVATNAELWEEVDSVHVECFGFDRRTAKFACHLCCHRTAFCSMINHAFAMHHSEGRKCIHCQRVLSNLGTFVMHHEQTHPALEISDSSASRIELYNACFPPGSQPVEQGTTYRGTRGGCRITVDCGKCGDKVNVQNAMFHARSHAETITKYVCPHCTYDHATRQDVQKHMKHNHPEMGGTVIKPYEQGQAFRDENRECVLECFGFNRVECDYCHVTASFWTMHKHINSHLEEIEHTVSFAQMAHRCFDLVLNVADN